MAIEELIGASEAPAPSISPAEAARICATAFGVRGHCEPLAGERDRNFRLTDSGGKRHVLKVWNRTLPQAVVDLQVRALQHLERTDPDLPVPRVETGAEPPWIEVRDASGQSSPACMLSWLDGVFLREVVLGPDGLEAAGRALARLDRALGDFRHPAQARDLLWDLALADRLRPLAERLEDDDVRRAVLGSLEDFATIRPLLEGFRRQVIHADYNLDNVLVSIGGSDTISGIIDFGDLLEGPLVCELAIACAYQLADGPDPLAGALPMIRGYHRALPLTGQERALLPCLIRARLACSVSITSHMARLHPENRDYLLIDTAAAADRLRRLSATTTAQDAERINSACEES